MGKITIIIESNDYSSEELEQLAHDLSFDWAGEHDAFIVPSDD